MANDYNLPKPNKPLAVQPDQDKHERIEDVETKDEKDFSGDMTDPETLTGAENPEPQDTEDMMHQVGLGHGAMNKGEVAQSELNSQQDMGEDEEEEQQS